jgi:biopolymer transport protein ExbD
MKYMLLVCSIALTLTLASLPQALGQSPALQKGVSVQMATTNNATAMPQADYDDAWVVAVTADGGIFFGAESMTTDGLSEWMKTHPRNREAKLYIKADARASFASVEKVLEIGRVMGFETPILLTAQAEHNAPGTMVPPKGVEVTVGSAVPSGKIATLVQLLPSGQDPPLLINGDQSSWSALEDTLRRHFLKGDDKLVLLRVDVGLPFAEVVHAIDSCRAAGARAYLAGPGL